MHYTAAVITISDKGSRGERTDTSGPALQEILSSKGWTVAHTAMLPDDYEAIKAELIKCADELAIQLVLTTGGTGFSPRDITPEATLAVIERETRGIPEAMRAESMKITPRGMLSRAVAGIRGRTLIVNLPGSEKAVRECLNAVIGALMHGIDTLCGNSGDCAPSAQLCGKSAKILAVCISEKKGEQKHPVPKVKLKMEHGIMGDAHAGNWHRQISLLGIESVDKLRAKLDIELSAGAFAENILTEGIELYRLPVGTKLRIGEALCEVTQIGKECHNDCAIRKTCGDCVMPREGIFVKVLGEGEVKAGDIITVL